MRRSAEGLPHGFLHHHHHHYRLFILPWGGESWGLDKKHHARACAQNGASFFSFSSKKGVKKNQCSQISGLRAEKKNPRELRTSSAISSSYATIDNRLRPGGFSSGDPQTSPQLSQLTRKSQQVRRRRCTGRVKLSCSHKFETCNHTGGTRARHQRFTIRKHPSPTHTRGPLPVRVLPAPAAAAPPSAARSRLLQKSWRRREGEERGRGERERRGQESGGRRGEERPGAAGAATARCRSSVKGWRGTGRTWARRVRGRLGGCAGCGRIAARHLSDGVVTAHTHTHCSNSHRFPKIAALRRLVRKGGW